MNSRDYGRWWIAQQHQRNRYRWRLLELAVKYRRPKQQKEAALLISAN